MGTRRAHPSPEIDAVNLRITYHLATDSIYATTGIGGEAAMELGHVTQQGEPQFSVRGATCTDRTRVAELIIAS